MAETSDNASDQTTVVGEINEVRERRKASAQDDNVQVQPSETVDAQRRQKIAKTAMGMGVKSASMGDFGAQSGADISRGTGTNTYSPHMSSDFLELPQNESQEMAYYRHFYNKNPYVNRAINLHTDLPLSKIRLTMPRGNDPDLNDYILEFFRNMVDRIDLLETLVDATREYYVFGDAFLFAEDSTVDVPDFITHDTRHHIDEQNNVVEEKVERPNAEQLKQRYIQKNYQGWESLTILPPDHVRVESQSFLEGDFIELVPDSQTRELVEKAAAGDPDAIEKVSHMPDEVRAYIESGENIPLGTDPSEGSFVYHLARQKAPYEQRGHSILESCLRDLVFGDKLRQAQTSIASRAMTPKRIVWAENLDAKDVNNLRNQVDQALLDPDFSIITNYQVNWEEISADDRLLNLSSEYDHINERLFAGLGVTRSMLTGDSTYSGERIHIEVINTRYLRYREMLQNYVEEELFKPVARRKGFVEEDKFGHERVIYPKLSFTRLAIRDNRDTFDNLFNLYQKGSLPVSYILELFNLDPHAVRKRMENDLFTINDPQFNEAVRGVLSEVGRNVVENSDYGEVFVDYINNVSQFEIDYSQDDEDGGRF